MDILQFYDDFHVDYMTEGHRHCRPGWVNTPCPFCIGNPGYHLGFSLNRNNFTCYRCGSHSTIEVVSTLANVSKKEAFALIKKYNGLLDRTSLPQEEIQKKEFKLPTQLTTLQTPHKNYLRKRGFDPDFIASAFEVQSIGPIGFLDKMSLKWRLFIPIFWEGRMVSFQTRDITDNHPFKYITCPKNSEIIHHKHILYGNEKHWQKTRKGICVEGVTDVWKLRDYAFAVFGIKYKRQQVKEIMKNFDEVCIVFDDEPQAQEQAQKLMAALSIRGMKKVWVEKIVGDPASLTDEQADALVNKILAKMT